MLRRTGLNSIPPLRPCLKALVTNSTEVLLNGGENPLPPPWLLIGCILFNVFGIDPNKRLGDLDGKMLLVIQIRVDENASDPFFSIVVVRVEIQCSNECIVSGICASNYDFVPVVVMKRRVESEVAKSDCERLVSRGTKVRGVRHIQVPEFNRSLECSSGPDGKETLQMYTKCWGRLFLEGSRCHLGKRQRRG